MLALAIITLFLTGFAFVYYSYLSEHSEKDVSFFLSVLLISMVMNLCTNMGGNNSVIGGFAIVYLIITVLFIGLGFAIDLHNTLAFYKSIGPWFKRTFTNAKMIGWQILSFIVFPAGLVLFFVDYKPQPALAKTCGRCAAFGLLVWGLLLWMILGVVL